MKFVKFRDTFFDASKVELIEVDGRFVYIETATGRKEFKFAGTLEASWSATFFVQRLEIFGQTDNNTILDSINAMEEHNRERHGTVMAKISTLAAKLADIEKHQDEADAEIRKRLDDLTAEIVTLQELLGDAKIPAEAEATLERVSSKAKALADIIPNAPPA